MIAKEVFSTIEDAAKEFFQKVGIDGTVQVKADEDTGVSIDVTLQEPQLYIGEKGQTLFEIQHILKAIIRKKIPEQQLYISLDINEYKQNKESYLRELARSAADEVALLKKAKELPPMPPAERRIVHMELAERSDISTESDGEGDLRRVVIRGKN
ncbi:hypothetical protein IIA94_03290 [Patescibacteria group bacterium]|nr:hypothetical protein [Patescibacteria group bacterium]